jgi:hypothetical protein
LAFLRQKIKVEFRSTLKDFKGEIQRELVPISQVPMGVHIGNKFKNCGNMGTISLGTKM